MIKFKKFNDFSKRKKLKKVEQINLLIFYLLKKKSNNNLIKFKLMLKKQLLFNYTKVKIINRCINSNKIRSISRNTTLTKSSFKDYYSYGNITGFKKSSW